MNFNALKLFKLILDGTIESLQAALNTLEIFGTFSGFLEIFGTFSGLKVNKDKTQIAWIGKKRPVKIKSLLRTVHLVLYLVLSYWGSIFH